MNIMGEYHRERRRMLRLAFIFAVIELFLGAVLLGLFVYLGNDASPILLLGMVWCIVMAFWVFNFMRPKPER